MLESKQKLKKMNRLNHHKETCCYGPPVGLELLESLLPQAKRGEAGVCPATSPTSRGRRTWWQVKADVLARGRGKVAISHRRTKQEQGGESMCLQLGAVHISQHRKAVVEGIDSQL